MVTLILTVSWVWCVGFVIADATGITSGFYEGFIYFIIYLFFSMQVLNTNILLYSFKDLH